MANNKIKKSELLRAFKADQKEAERLQREWFIKREEWLSETYGQPYGNEEEGKSKIVSKDIKKQLEWMLPSITDPFLSTPDVIKCNPITFEDVQAARQNELLLNTQFCRKFNRYNFVMKATRVLATEGSVVIQTGWDYEDEEYEVESEFIAVDEDGIEYIDSEMITETKVITNQPTATVCRNEDIFIDPTCMDDMDKCQFVIHRYETNISSLRADGRYKNLDRLAKQQHSLSDDPQYYREDITYFEFKDEPRKKMVVHEYWGNYDIDGDGELEAIVCAWVGDTIIRLELNPYPDNKPPFIVVPFNAIPFQMFGEALAETIGDNQKVKTAITRGLIDNMARSNNGQIGLRKGSLDMANRKKFLSGKNFEFNGSPNDFWEGGFNQLPGSAFDMLNLMNNEIESQTGVKSFSGGINSGSLGATATGARGALDATSTRRLNLVRNFSENLIKPLMRKWMAYNSEFLEEEEIIRVTNDEYVPVRKDDLAGNIDIDISISTAEDNAAKADQLTFMLQTTAQSMDADMKFELLAKWADLSRLPEEAEKLRQKADIVRQQMSQPDPAKQAEIRRMELQNELLAAQIEAAKASAQEDIADKLEKIAQAEYKKAQTRKLHSEADNADLKFLKDNEGIDSKETTERELMKMQHQYEMAMLQKNAGDTQIGMVR